MTKEQEKNMERAFPQLSATLNDDGHWSMDAIQGGLSKREYFAGLAMQGILAGDPETSVEVNETPRAVALISVLVADALLVELKRTQKAPASPPPPQEGST